MLNSDTFHIHIKTAFRRAARLVLSALSLWLASCASVSVDNIRQTSARPPLTAPDEILILPFAWNQSDLRVDRKGKDFEKFREELQARLNRHLIKKLGTHVAPARVISEEDGLPRGNYWLLTGRFARINQGSRLLRSTLGLGAGGTKMETIVVVQDLSGPSPNKFLAFETTGGSNISQGIGGVVTLPVSGPMALTSLFNAVDGIRSGVSFDTMRTAHEISATLSDYLHERDALGKKPHIKPKRLGEVPLHLPFAKAKKKPADPSGTP
ncbi:MAG: DUF4410 domain-containing protein [Spartobacteria bacterium]